MRLLADVMLVLRVIVVASFSVFATVSWQLGKPWHCLFFVSYAAFVIVAGAKSGPKDG